MSSSILFPTNEYTTSNKSSEQIQKLMIAEEEPIEILKHILSKGHALQLPYVYSNFHLFKTELLTSVCERLPKEEQENQILIVEGFKKITFTQREEKLVFEALLQALRNWSTINTSHLVDGIENVVSKAIDKSYMMQIMERNIYELGKNTQPIVSKVIAGRLVTIFSKENNGVIKGEMIDIIKRIIMDSEIQAKKVWIAEIFPKLLTHLKSEFIELHLQQKVYETVYDQNEEIGLMALEVILRNTEKFSLQEQSSRIVKLFIDSLTSKNEKIALLATSFMGTTFQKLQNIILKNETQCLRFWKSFIEIAESKNEQIINNFIYNLPGILLLSKKYHRVDPLCDVYAELFYHSQSDTFMLVSYFHEMAKMFPSKKNILRETVFSFFSEVFEENQVSDQSMKIIDALISNLFDSKDVFLQDVEEDEDTKTKNTEESKSIYFNGTFCDYLFKYFNLCLSKKNGKWLENLYCSLIKCHKNFAPSFTQISLLPKLYSAIRSKSAFLPKIMELIVLFLARQCSSNFLINNYVSKINIELGKSSKAHERYAALLFYYHCSFNFSVQTFQEFKMGEKFLQFSNDKSLANKLKFVEFSPRINYFLSNQQKIQFTIILNKLRKDPDPQVLKLIEATDFQQYDQVNTQINTRSQEIKEIEKNRCTLSKKSVVQNRRQPIKDLKKQDVLKKRVETRSRTKILIKEASKRKTTIPVIRPMLRKNS